MTTGDRRLWKQQEQQQEDDDDVHATTTNFAAMTDTESCSPKSLFFKIFSCDAETRHPVRSFFVIYTMIFFNGCCFTAVVPSVPFYLEVLQAPPWFLGWVISFYSVGQMIGSPTGGWLADKISTKNLLIGSSVLGLLSSLIYSTAPTYMLILVARLLTGISAGMEISTELAYIAKNTSTKERTFYLGSVSAVNVLGFILGPVLAGLLSTVDAGIFGLSINKYTGPGWLLTTMFLLNIGMLKGLFKDQQQNYHEGTVTLEQRPPRPPALPLVLGLIFVQFTIMCSWSVLETITSPLAEDYFGWDVEHCDILFACGGAVSLVAYIVFSLASKWTQDRWIIVCALILSIIGQLLAINWYELGWVPKFALELLPWTYKTRFVVGYMIMNAGFMTCRPVTIALYSKLIGAENQGKYLGWMVSGGSAARMIGPFIAVALFYQVQASGVNLLLIFGLVGILHAGCLVLVCVLWSQMLPSTKSLPERDDATRPTNPLREELMVHNSDELL